MILERLEQLGALTVADLQSMLTAEFTPVVVLVAALVGAAPFVFVTRLKERLAATAAASPGFTTPPTAAAAPPLPPAAAPASAPVAFMVTVKKGAAVVASARPIDGCAHQGAARRHPRGATPHHTRPDAQHHTTRDLTRDARRDVRRDERPTRTRVRGSAAALPPMRRRRARGHRWDGVWVCVGTGAGNWPVQLGLGG